MPTSERWPVRAKFLLRRDGRWMSYDERVLGLISTSPSGCLRENLASAVGLLVDELDVIVNRLIASGKIERNGDVFCGVHDFNPPQVLDPPDGS